MPFITPITYLFLLPASTMFSDLVDPDEDYASAAEYAPLATADDEDSENVIADKVAPIGLSAQDKWRLLKPMLLKYMLPLCESVIFSGLCWLTFYISRRIPRGSLFSTHPT